MARLGIDDRILCKVSWISYVRGARRNISKQTIQVGPALSDLYCFLFLSE